MIFHNRQFQIQFTGQCADTGRTRQFLHVGLLRGHFQHTADPAAILHGNARLEQFHILYGIRIERREQSEQMRGIIHRSAIKQYQVLVCRPASHIIAARSLSDGSDTRQREHHLHDIRLAKGRRDVLQQLGLELLRTHRRAFHSRLAAGDNDDLGEFLIIGNTGLCLLHARHDIGLCVCRTGCRKRVAVKNGNTGDEGVLWIVYS